MTVWSDEAEQMIRTLDNNSDEGRIFVHLKDNVDLTAGYSGPLNLEEAYREYQAKYFVGRVPELSTDFVCVFQSLPYDTAGITIMEGDERIPGVKKGIRINKRLEMMRSETRVALLHEMIHAAEGRGHGSVFKKEILRLLIEGAYGNFSTEDAYDGIL